MRRIQRPGWAALACLAVVLCPCVSGHADTIVLKNGKRIVAAGITHENGKVTYETAAGEMSLPESIVDRVEKNSAAPGGLTVPALKSESLGVNMAPPRRELGDGEGQAVRETVHDGSIDQNALAHLDAAAVNGSSDAVGKAAAAESAAGQFEFGKGDVDDALNHAERAMTLAPGEVPYLLDVAYLHLQRSDGAAALEVLEKARRLQPDSPDVAKLTGWAEYGLNRLPEAVAAWKRAQMLRPEADVAKALDKATRDLEVESNFRQGQSAHFDLRYYGGTAPDLAHDVLKLLEQDYQATASELDFEPSEPIGVVLYTNEAFTDVTRAPKWVNALNDGRIRVPVQGLESVTPELERVLAHELAHSFIAQKTRGHAPVWLQEGVAQWMDGSRVGPSAAAELISRYDRHEDPSLSTLEGSWLGSTGEAASVAYAWSLAVIEAVAAAGGPGDVDRLLDATNTQSSAEAAVHEALRMSYSDLNGATAQYLRRQYLP